MRHPTAGRTPKPTFLHLGGRLFIGLVLCLTEPSVAATQAVTIGQASVPLAGPWKFQTGDDPRWATVDFDDSSWEDVDLTAPRGARDNDVGLPGYVPGWESRGHAGYYGYAWYRAHFAVSAPPGETLALAGPLAVDTAYQLYVNGRLLGGVGEFSGASPIARSNHRPMLFPLPPDIANGEEVVIAVRAWMGAWPRSPGGGGMHVAPILGTSQAVGDQYQVQWLILVEGYVVDAVEGLALVLLGLVALSLMPFDRANRSYLWLALALLFLAVHRGNQAIMFLGSFETLREFEIFIITLAIPLYMGTWLIAWRSWLRLERPAWLPVAIAGLTLAYGLAAFLTRSWFRGSFPDFVFTDLRYVINCVRYALLVIYIFTIYQGVRLPGREAWYTLPAMLVLAVGLFGSELFYLGTRGIWFPFGIGLSLSEVAYGAFSLLLAAMLLRRLWSFARVSHYVPELRP